VTPGGEIAWEFRNPNSVEGRPIVIVRARRLSGDADEPRFDPSD
jgi:hypothetical protein